MIKRFIQTFAKYETAVGGYQRMCSGIRAEALILLITARILFHDTSYRRLYYPIFSGIFLKVNLWLEVLMPKKEISPLGEGGVDTVNHRLELEKELG